MSCLKTGLMEKSYNYFLLSVGSYAEDWKNYVYFVSVWKRATPIQSTLCDWQRRLKCRVCLLILPYVVP